MNRSPETVLIVGATGFIGSALVRRLLSRGQKVVCMSLAGRKQLQRMPEGVVTVEAASTSVTDICDAIKRSQADLAINLVAAGVKPSERDMTTMLDINVNFVGRLIEAISKTSVTRLLHTGSWSSYADTKPGHFIAEDHSLLTRQIYGGTKAAGDVFGHALAANLGVSFLVARLFHVWGQGEPEYRLTPTLIDHLSQRKTVKLRSGNQVRDMLYVDDAADGLVALASLEDEAPPVVNICSGKETSVRAFAEMIADGMNVPKTLLEFGALAERGDEAAWMVGDNTLITELTGWYPKMSIAQGLAEMRLRAKD